MSDRPPLQVGYVLSQHAFLNTSKNLHYEVLCVIVQQFWIVGMWAVLCAGRVSTRTRSLAMFAAIVSDVAIVHGFFVWPKLLAAGFLLAHWPSSCQPIGTTLRRDVRVGALFGVLLALALLSHGSSLFAVVPFLLFIFLRGLPTWRWLRQPPVLGVVLLAPWSAYQHYANPPGNRLLKWHLGGAIADQFEEHIRGHRGALPGRWTG